LASLENLSEACVVFYGDRLVSLVVFGSVGRKTVRPDSDIDILIVANDQGSEEAQEIVKLALKGMLRQVGVELQNGTM
jgi:predicted nucleotidyltransferase